MPGHCANISCPDNEIFAIRNPFIRHSFNHRSCSNRCTGCTASALYEERFRDSLEMYDLGTTIYIFTSILSDSVKKVPV